MEVICHCLLQWITFCQVLASREMAFGHSVAGQHAWCPACPSAAPCWVFQPSLAIMCRSICGQRLRQRHCWSDWEGSLVRLELMLDDAQRSNCQHMVIIQKAREAGHSPLPLPPPKIYFSFIDHVKPLTLCITTNCGRFLKRWKYQTTWPVSPETWMWGILEATVRTGHGPMKVKQKSPNHVRLFETWWTM